GERPSAGAPARALALARDPAVSRSLSAAEPGRVEVADDAGRCDTDRSRGDQSAEPARRRAGEGEERRRLVEAAEALVAAGELAPVLVHRPDEGEEREATEERAVRRPPVGQPV